MTEPASPPYEEMVRALPGFFAHITVDGNFLFLNRVAPGFTQEQIRNTTIFAFTPPEYHDRMRACLETVVRTRAQAGYSSMGEGAYAKIVPYYTIVAPLLDGDRVSSLVLLATDVSHVADAYAQLQTSQTKLQLALESTGMGIWTYDRTRDEVTWDEALAKLYGHPAASRICTAKDSLENIHPDDLQRVLQEFATIDTKGRYGPIEHRVLRVDGSVRWVSSSGRLRDAVVVGGVFDITERKLREEHFAQAQKLDSIGRLAGGVAHDFNNMLTAILGYADLCIASTPPGAKMVSDLQEIKRAAERSRELTSRLLMFARKQRVEHQVVNPNTLVQQVDRLLQRIVGEDVTVVSTLRASRNVRVDPHQLEQLLVNLVTNSRDAMPHGGRILIETSDLDTHEGELVGPQVRIRVIDDGAGIAKELLEHIFEPFFTTKEPNKGTGLGLAQCYGIARQAGGLLRVTSTVGVGTQVTLDLPAVAEKVTELDTTDTKVEGGGETLLLVEDEPLIRKLAGRLLRAEGYTVLEASNGPAALGLAAAHAGVIDLLVTDMVMPEMTGVAVAEVLKLARPTIAVMIMSGYSSELTDRMPEVAFLAKPFMPHELLAKVREALGRHER